MSPDVVAEHLGREIREAGTALLAKVSEEPVRWWYAYELKDQARNGWSAGAMDIAFNRLIDTGKLDIKGDQVHIHE